MKTKTLWMIAAAAGAVLLAACSTPDSRISKHPEIFARLSPQDQALVRSGQVGLGMDMDTVRLALGDPDRVSLRTSAKGQTVIWHYQQTVYYDGAFLYPGPYWGEPYWGRWHRRWAGWGYWGPPPGPLDFPVGVYDRFIIEFQGGRVTAIHQEA